MLTKHAGKYPLMLIALVVFLLAASDSALGAATITVVNIDGLNEGFNDPTPVAPVGGNPGTTRGQQRLIAFQFAADLWGATLDSNVQVRVNAAFNPLGANVLGSAGTTFVFSDFGGVFPFPGAQFGNTWYHSALADKRAGAELNPGFADINAQFSSNFNFYLGLDNNHGALNDLVVVVLHELAHGLGFSAFVNSSTGANFAGRTDIFSRFAFDNTVGLFWNNMTNAQRQASAINFGNLVWVGGNVTADVPNVLSFGSPSVRIDSPPVIAGLKQFGTAAFGPPISAPGITAPVMLVNDGVAPTSDGCEALPAGSLTGKIALIDRGLCGFVVKAKIAQNAGALAVIIANNVAGAPPGMAGVDPTVVIPSVSISLADGNAIKAQLAGGVVATLSVDLSVRAGADPAGRARLNAPNPVQPGSSVSHFDPIAFRNQLMEPAINPDLTHNLTAPEDLTLAQMRDVGWFADAQLDGIPDDVQICMQQGPISLTYNTSTGQYLFFDCSKGISLTGVGTVAQNFCKLTLTDKGPVPKIPDRNVSILVNTCTGDGNATISFGGKTYSISDGNISVGSCGCL
ncbi:MAG TPA: PA domain-containing protein [Blastocatellia bacterium]|nr:PA domain-containing protein [Blastocatellia bacterium]